MAIVCVRVHMLLEDGDRRGESGDELAAGRAQPQLPVLVQMSELGSPYMRALQLFRLRSIYANSVGDHQVPTQPAGSKPNS